MLTLSTYVLIAPARNAAKFVELTIKSVAAQTVRPAKWVTVSDGWTSIPVSTAAQLIDFLYYSMQHGPLS
jgi:hypothetical protein